MIFLTPVLLVVCYSENEFRAIAFRKTQILIDATSVSRAEWFNQVAKVLLAATMIDVCPRYTLYVYT